MPSDSNDKDIREFFGDSGERDDAVLEELIASGCMSESKLGAGFGDGVVDSTILNDFWQALKRLAEKQGPAVPIGECRRILTLYGPEVLESFERHYRAEQFDAICEALGIKIVR